MTPVVLAGNESTKAEAGFGAALPCLIAATMRYRRLVRATDVVNRTSITLPDGTRAVTQSAPGAQLKW